MQASGIPNLDGAMMKLSYRCTRCSAYHSVTPEFLCSLCGYAQNPEPSIDVSFSVLNDTPCPITEIVISPLLCSPEYIHDPLFNWEGEEY